MTKLIPSDLDRLPVGSVKLRPSDDRGPGRRTRSMLTGIVAYNDGASSFFCAIRNLSTTGARILVPTGVTFPSRLFLIVVRHRIAHEAEVVWLDRNEVGLKFGRSIDLHDGMDNKLAFLSRLWHGGVS